MIGETISHYRITEKLGGGGMGIVYKAQDLKLERPVALKFLPPDLTRDPEAKVRFVHEARAASSLQHENICVVHDIDETSDGQTFIVLEYYQGQTVKKLLANGPLPIDRAIDIAIQVGEGLAEAHRHGIVHRDIKPANVMLTAQGKARIVDFGVALLTGMTRVTTDGHKVGTVTHMSPEQARGEPVDSRSDIWSLGVLLYEMISGRLPFDSSYEQALVYSILNADPHPVSEICPDAPPRLEAVLRKALAKDPRSRYQKIEEMVSDLGELIGRPAGSGSSRRATGTSLAAGRKRRILIPALVVVGLFIAGGLWLFRERSSMERGGTRHVALNLLPVRNGTRQTRVDGWGRVVEHTYLPNELAGRSDVSLFHEGSPGFIPDFDLSGEIVQAESLFILQLNLQDPRTGRLRWAANASFAGPEGLENAASSVTRHILWFLEIRVLNQDIDPWMPRMLSDSTNLAFLKAMTYTYTGQAGADVYLNEALRLDSTFVAPRVWLIPSLVLERTKEGRDEALRHYRVLERLRSRVTPFELAMIELCGCYLNSDLQCRAGALERGLRFAPGNRIVLVNLGLAYYRLEKFEKAIEAYEPVVRTEMPYPDAYWEYARVLTKTKRFDEAREVLGKALLIHPVPTETYEYVAAFAWKDRDSTKARSFELSSMERSDSRMRTWGEVYDAMGRILIDLEEPLLAARFLRSALRENPKAASRHSALARAFLAMGDTAAGEREAESALALDESCAEAHALLGWLCQGRGLADESRVHFQKYLKQDSLTVTALTIRRALGELRSTVAPAMAY